MLKHLQNKQQTFGQKLEIFNTSTLSLMRICCFTSYFSTYIRELSNGFTTYSTQFQLLSKHPYGRLSRNVVNCPFTFKYLCFPLGGRSQFLHDWAVRKVVPLQVSQYFSGGLLLITYPGVTIRRLSFYLHLAVLTSVGIVQDEHLRTDKYLKRRSLYDLFPESFHFLGNSKVSGVKLPFLGHISCKDRQQYYHY